MEDSLASPVQYVKGVGPARAKALEQAGIRSVEDLLLYAPRRYVDRRHCAAVADLSEGDQATVMGEVLTAGVRRGRKPRFTARITDGTGILEAVWFRGVPYVQSALSPGDLVVLSGRVGAWRGTLQMAHPEFEVLGSSADPEGDDPLDEALHAGGLIPIYPQTAELRSVGLSSRGLRRVLRNALESVAGEVSDPLTAEIRQKRDLLPSAEAFRQLHFPADYPGAESARRRLAYEEFFFLELLLAERSRNTRRREGHACRTWGSLVRGYIEGLPFTLTRAQQRVIAEIFEDMARPHPMNRLLQGDVGSGKTAVAACVLLTAVENGMQAALMAPTEILAEQHARRLKDEFSAAGVPVHFLASRLSAAERSAVLEELEGGNPSIVIGTHALIQKDVGFSRLGAVVVDEQHRFGVLQRGALQAKGAGPHVLVMTATPIPRTLAMTLYGDLVTSVIDEMPPGRQPVETTMVPLESRDHIVKRVGELLAERRQAYWVFPLVEETERTDLRAATESYEHLSGGPLSDFRLGLVHGRLRSEEKDEVMDRFRSGKIDLLVSTTVIEVGVDVPNASLMLIEHAERFGLSQLHQLRGRVGRGGGEAACILLHDQPLSEDASRRLQAMCSTTDGFRIAETDLEIRGPGEFFGTRQHGLPELRIASLVGDQRLLSQAREDAFAALGMADGDETSQPRVSDEVLRSWREVLGRRVGARAALGEIA